MGWGVEHYSAVVFGIGALLVWNVNVSSASLLTRHAFFAEWGFVMTTIYSTSSLLTQFLLAIVGEKISVESRFLAGYIGACLSAAVFPPVFVYMANTTAGNWAGFLVVTLNGISSAICLATSNAFIAVVKPDAVGLVSWGLGIGGILSFIGQLGLSAVFDGASRDAAFTQLVIFYVAAAVVEAACVVTYFAFVQSPRVQESLAALRRAVANSSSQSADAEEGRVVAVAEAPNTSLLAPSPATGDASSISGSVAPEDRVSYGTAGSTAPESAGVGKGGKEVSEGLVVRGRETRSRSTGVAEAVEEESSSNQNRMAPILKALFDITTLFANMMFTFVVFPGVLLSLKPTGGLIAPENFGLIMTGTFQVFDFLGFPIAAVGGVLPDGLARVGILTFRLLMCAALVIIQRLQANMDIPWANEVVLIAMAASFAITNGWMLATCFTAGPGRVTSGRDKQSVGLVASFTSGVGIQVGSYLAMLTQWGATRR
mmetsp:Transcript_39716/g.78265  ORF Transcript_39716/g.78265 Transcript_39716/m.78265 type:complete len:485 (-) Transcript_39716:534-1988(-)